MPNGGSDCCGNCVFNCVTQEVAFTDEKEGNEHKP